MKTADVNGYLEGGTIKTADHKTVGFTPEAIQKAIELLKHPKFAYSRWKNYGIAIYVRDDESPTGVRNAGGIPHELEFLIKDYQKYGQPLQGLEALPEEDNAEAHRDQWIDEITEARLEDIAGIDRPDVVQPVDRQDDGLQPRQIPSGCG